MIVHQSVVFISAICFLILDTSAQDLWLTRTAEIQFKSDAPLELIQAKSVDVTGTIRTTDNTFAFSVLNESFKGFNSPLQQEHFYENYMETDQYVRSSFSGKIIDAIDFSVSGEHKVRAKGLLDIHGVQLRRIIEVKLNVSNETISLRSNFTVLLADHGIRIPKIVNQKIAKEIQVFVRAELENKSAK